MQLLIDKWFLRKTYLLSTLWPRLRETLFRTLFAFCFVSSRAAQIAALLFVWRWLDCFQNLIHLKKTVKKSESSGFLILLPHATEGGRRLYGIFFGCFRPHPRRRRRRVTSIRPASLGSHWPPSTSSHEEEFSKWHWGLTRHSTQSNNMQLNHLFFQS